MTASGKSMINYRLLALRIFCVNHRMSQTNKLDYKSGCERGREFSGALQILL